MESGVAELATPPTYDDDIVEYLVSAVRQFAGESVNKRVDRVVEESMSGRHELDMDANR